MGPKKEPFLPMVLMVKQDQTSKFHEKRLHLSFLSPTPSSTSQTPAVCRQVTDFHTLGKCGCLLSYGFQTTRMLAYNMQEYLGQVPHLAHSCRYPRCWGGAEESYYTFNVCMYLTIFGTSEQNIISPILSSFIMLEYKTRKTRFELKEGIFWRFVKLHNTKISLALEPII